MFFPSHLEAAKKIIGLYNGNEPFHLFIKKYFSKNKKHGGKDRKSISGLCYNFFRLGHARKDLQIEDRILLASQIVNQMQAMESDAQMPVVPESRKSEVEKYGLVTEIFPFSSALSEGIDHSAFSQSFLRQPFVFIRIRPGMHEKVLNKISNSGIHYIRFNEECVGFINASNIESLLEIDKDVQLQDYNSQRTGDLIRIAAQQNKISEVWDCCAASGGKSIMAYDILEKIKLTVTDKRKSILENLEKRFSVAGIKNFHSFMADLESSTPQDVTGKFDLVIADLPCTGSGTWSRTPEQLYFFQEKKIDDYSRLQKNILTNVIPALKNNGQLLYITCSVFRKENEDVVEFLQEKFNLRLHKMEVLKGYDVQADTMFAALLSKS